MIEQRQLDDFSMGARDLTKPKTEDSIKLRIPEDNEVTSKKYKKMDPLELPPSYLVSVQYDGGRSLACLKLYEPRSQTIHFWHDTTDHKPYLLTNLSPYELDQLKGVKTHPGFDHFEQVEKFNPILNRNVTLTKVVAKDPLAIGGKPRGCLREIIPEEYSQTKRPEELEPKVWEAAIKYYQCYIYDRDILPGMVYSVKKGHLVPEEKATENAMKNIQKIFTDRTAEEKEYLERWAYLLEYPAPTFKRVAFDIEVFSPVPTRVPDPREAPYEVICASFMATDKDPRVFLLKRNGVTEGSQKWTPNTKVEFFDSEENLIREIFRVLWEYPFVITFNGDDFDLRYLTHRALKLGVSHRDIPIEVRRRTCLLKNGVHIDLYKFFYNRSIQIYAFNNRYRDVTLNDVGVALVGLSKLDLGATFADLSYSQLAQYCLRDAEITYKLTSFDDDLTMKLIMVLARISRMPFEDVSRQGVSRWIRNFLQFEHRKLGMLIPNTSDILALKGKTATTAMIKGKKYKGAIVVEPVPGVHFNVAVMDFPSLYPSIIKVWNLGYQTILCPHEDCYDNLIPDTPHWVCRKKKALESLLIGSLRDLRVLWYKPQANNETLSSSVQNWYRVIQRALKVILNASYGVFGAEAFDLYCPPVAEATAAIGRHSITRIVRKAKDLGIEVLYGDTDSVFLKNPTEAQIKELANWSDEELKMALDVDKEYRYAAFSSRKKNYLGALKDGSVDVKGLTGKKKHIPAFIKNSFKDMMTRLGRVKSSVEFDEAKKDIKKIVLDCYTRLKRRKWENLNDLAFHVVLGEAPERYLKTTPQHVTAARILKDKKIEMRAGDLVSFVKIKPRTIRIGYDKTPQTVNVMPVQLATNSDIDVEKYVSYLNSTFDQVLDALGLDFNEIIGLTKLERFM